MITYQLASSVTELRAAPGDCIRSQVLVIHCVTLPTYQPEELKPFTENLLSSYY